jgi:hypothetical protein
MLKNVEHLYITPIQSPRCCIIDSSWLYNLQYKKSKLIIVEHIKVTVRLFQPQGAYLKVYTPF